MILPNENEKGRRFSTLVVLHVTRREYAYPIAQRSTGLPWPL